MCYAGWTKGSAALLLAVTAAAKSGGVEKALMAEWSRSQPLLPDQLDREANANAAKAWRFVGEMEEIAKTFADSGLPSEFHDAAAQIYSRLAQLRDATPPVSTTDVIACLIKGGHLPG